MDNKLIFENWRRFLLVEAELQYSKSAAQEIKSLVRKYVSTVGASKNDQKADWVNIPQKEIFYSNNPKIINGAVFYRLTRTLTKWDWDNLTDDQLSQLQSLWDSSSKSFAPEFIEAQLNYDYPMEVVINKKGSTSMGTSTAAISSKNGFLFFYLSINPMNMSGDKASSIIEVLEDTVRHELQHVTQSLNGLALNYGEQLAKANGDFSKIKVVNDSADIKKFGLGREETGLRQAQGEEKKKLAHNERVKRYLGDDFEYETWMSDIISQFIRWSGKQGSLSPEAIKSAKFKSQFDPNNMTSQSRKMLAQTAQATGQTAKQVFRSFQGQKTFDELATGLVRELIKGMEVSSQKPSEWKAGEVLNAFGKDTMMDNVAAFQLLSKLRKKEFLGDFLDNLTQRLKKQ
tara:strand:- start:43 stop:1245 length:1203 start_codon:yes stop_codon:yes gene_type:complete